MANAANLSERRVSRRNELVSLYSVLNAVGELNSAASGRADDLAAASASDQRVGVGEDGRDADATLALDIEELRIGSLQEMKPSKGNFNLQA